MCGIFYFNGDRERGEGVSSRAMGVDGEVSRCHHVSPIIMRWGPLESRSLSGENPAPDLLPTIIVKFQF